MNDYSKFIKYSFSIVSELLPPNEIPTSVFAFGGIPDFKTNGQIQYSSPNSSPSLPSDYAILSNNKAYIFYAILISHSDMFGINPSSVRIHHSRLFPDEVSVSHSCYSRNLKRWMNGQKSRKRLTRAEYVTLIYCWTMNWFDNLPLESVHIECYKQLKHLCIELLSHDENADTDLLSLLWKTSNKCYLSSYLPQDSSIGIP